MSDGVIWRHFGGGHVGDMWAVAQWLLRESERTGRPARIARDLQQIDYGPDIGRDLINQAAALLDSTGSIEWVANPDETQIIQHAELWARGPRMRTKRQWDGGSAGTIAYQFDGVSVAMLKNPPPADLERLTSWAPADRLVKLGLPLTLEQSVEALSKCAVMIGICSGMSHLAHAVGCPMVLIQYRQYVDNWHPEAGWTKAEGTDDAIAKASTLYETIPAMRRALKGHT